MHKKQEAVGIMHSAEETKQDINSHRLNITPIQETFCLPLNKKLVRKLGRKLVMYFFNKIS